jgi:hypothetical protein
LLVYYYLVRYAYSVHSREFEIDRERERERVRERETDPSIILWNDPFNLRRFMEWSIFTFCGTVHFYILHDEWDSGRIHIAGKWKHIPEKQYWWSY